MNYRDLVKDPIGTVRGIYQTCGRDLDAGMEQRMHKWLADNAATKHGVHRYDLEQFGLTHVDVDQQFAAYQERFHRPVACV